jgi:hypothetical protein
LHRQLITAGYDRAIIENVDGTLEYGYAYTWDSGDFGRSAIAQPASHHTHVVAAGSQWRPAKWVDLGLRQEVLFGGDPNLMPGWNDHLITHGLARLHLTENLALTGTESLRWNGENQTSAGLQLKLSDTARVYANQRLALMGGGWSTTTVAGGENELTPNTRTYAEYQLQSAFSAEQSRGVVGLSSRWKLPFGFLLQGGYERVQTIGGSAPSTSRGTLPPGAFTDGTFYAAPGANGGGSFLYGDGSRDALSVGVEYRGIDKALASQRFELRYDNFNEDRGGTDRVWFLSMSNLQWAFTPELSVLARYNLGLANNLTYSSREAYFEEAVGGVAYRPITHDWFSLLSKISRRVEARPLSLSAGVFEDYTAHALALEPIVEMPVDVQLVSKVAFKHASQVIEAIGPDGVSDQLLPRGDAYTLLTLGRVNWHVLRTLRRYQVDFMPGDVDLGVEYRVLAGLTAGTTEHGPLVEAQVAPLPYFRLGVGFNFTQFSDNELARADENHYGFFMRAVGQY